MSDTVIVILEQDPAAALNWALMNDDGAWEVRAADDLTALAEYFSDYRDEIDFIGVLPGEYASFRSLPSPPRQHAKLKTAAEFLLEDELATNIDIEHIAIHRREGVANIIAVKNDRIDNWVSAFADAELTLTHIVVDFDCLPKRNAHGILYVDGARVLANFGDKGFAAEADLARPLLSEFFQNDADARLAVYGHRELEFTESRRYEKIGEANSETLFALVKDAVEQGNALNLLQGKFRPPRKNLVDIALWRRAGFMAAACACLFLIGIIADGARDGRLADRYSNEARRIHLEAFPTAQNVDIRSHARSILRGTTGGASFIDISSRLNNALEKHENVSIDRVRFEQDRGRYVFSVRSDSDAEIEAFRQSLSGFGVMASETGGYRRTGGFWVGDMAVRAQ